MNPSRFENFWETCPDRVVQAFRNKAREKDIAREISPHIDGKARHKFRTELVGRRERQRQGARFFLTEGDATGNGGAPSYGKVWDRSYNPMPYPDAMPSDWHIEHTFAGAEILFLYGLHGYERAAWQLAGWNLVRSGAEQRKVRRGK